MTSTGTKIDKTTTVNIVLVIALIGAAATGAIKLGHMDMTLQGTNRGIMELKAAVDRNTLQIGNDSKTQAVQGVQIRDLERRIRHLEAK
jgi:cell division protein FtsL